MKQRTLPLLVLSSLALSSCAVGVATTAGVAVGTAAVQEGGLSRAASDARIQVEINDRWFKHSVDMFTKLDMTINQGRVLLTGVVQDPQHRVEAVRLAWQPVGVVQVINEIKVANSTGVVGFAQDAWISGRLRAALIADREVESINYSIDTVQGSIYLMGFAQDQGELNHVIDKARRVPNVKQVVSYVKLVGTPEIRSGAPGYQQPFDSGNPSYNQPAGNGMNWNDGAHAGGQQQGLSSGDRVGGGYESGDTSGAANGDPIQWNQESVY